MRIRCMTLFEMQGVEAKIEVRLYNETVWLTASLIPTYL